MDRRNFLKAGAVAGAAAAVAPLAAAAVPEHDWHSYDWGSRPPVKDRLYQGPFPQYSSDGVVPGSEVVMVTTPSRDIVPNFGMGLTVYVSGDTGPPRIPGETLAKSIEDLIKLPFVQKVYLRPNWREVQQRAGRLDFPDWWQITFDLARRYNKPVGFRIMLENPDFPEPGMPAFLIDKVTSVRLKGNWPGNPAETRHRKQHALPRYDHPAYQAAFRELNALLADQLNGNPQVEYMDTMMYGFWGEGHSWPFEGNVFPSNAVAEQTWRQMLEVQLGLWTRTPLVTNTQPDFNKVGNADMLDRTVRSGNWIRSDTIFIENTQIEALSNRPSWIAAVSEVGMTTGEPSKLEIDDGVTLNEQIVDHVLAVGANYWSVWNWHNEAAANVLSYYDRYPEPIDRAARRIGYRIYPAFIWAFERDGAPGLVIGLANDGVAAVPGVLRLTVFSDDGTINASGCVDAGYPEPTGIRQAMLMLPSDAKWAGLKLKAEIEVKGVLYPVRWACRQHLNADGSLTLRRNLRSS
ncbi:twin-arginine translocation signal domain-containing protein [Sphingosinicellaceae bacterium]|nr:twin-arginine translocation signal domain-containing protein [Sphingosinicellaceae bacterium]